MSLKALKNSPFLLIYTTAYIKRIICMDLDVSHVDTLCVRILLYSVHLVFWQDPMVESCINPISTTSASWNYVKIPNEADVKLRVLPTDSATQNVMFLFESK